MNNKELYVISSIIDVGIGEIFRPPSIVLNTKEEVINWLNNNKNRIVKSITKEIYLYESNEIPCSEKIDEKVAELFTGFDGYDKEKIVAVLNPMKKKEVKNWLSNFQGYKDIVVEYQIQEKFKFGEENTKFYYKGFKRTNCCYCNYGKHDENINFFIKSSKNKNVLNLKLYLEFDIKDEFKEMLCNNN